MYNCSDQETIQQRQFKNFKRCLETVRIIGLQETLSWTFSRTKTKSSVGPMNSHVNKKKTHWIDDNLENDKSSNLENGDGQIEKLQQKI
ncbi:hypothetical protein L1987_71030 [Smallanthus sonchifolius]|uniref:Uncharacterized protein n=1 Tax=Smallanthus sonchifolius TaxID=185202 RepID=A0ACB9ASW0_9ASTR|nr:hypothetical protein L1987_71030 [Smallanthus sonchifolius]